MAFAMENMFAQEAGRLGMRLLWSIPGDKQKMCEYLKQEYGVCLPAHKTWRQIWEYAINFYGIEKMALISLKEMRRQIPDQDYFYLRGLFLSGRTPSYDECSQNMCLCKPGRWDKWGWILLKRDTERKTVSWTKYAEFFFRYVEVAERIMVDGAWKAKNGL